MGRKQILLRQKFSQQNVNPISPLVSGSSYTKHVLLVVDIVAVESSSWWLVAEIIRPYSVPQGPASFCLLDVPFHLFVSRLCNYHVIVAEIPPLSVPDLDAVYYFVFFAVALFFSWSDLLSHYHCHRFPRGRRRCRLLSLQ